MLTSCCIVRGDPSQLTIDHQGRPPVMRSTSIFAAVFVALLALPAFAQAPPAGAPARIRGTVEKLDGQALSVKQRDGQTVTVTVAPNAVQTLVKKSLADIK